MCGVPDGDFCDIARPDVYATDTVAEYMVRNDAEHVRQDLTENDYGSKNCATDSPYWAQN